MALAVVQVQHNYPLTGGSASNAVTFPSATTVGNRAVAIVHSYPNPPGTTAVTDNKGNTWTRDFATASGPIAFSVYSAPITTGGTSHIVTAAIAGADIINHDIIEVSGGATGTWLDKSVANSGTGIAYTTGSTGTLTQADEIVFVSVGVDTGDTQTITPDATYTLLATQGNGAGYVSSGAYKIVTVTTAVNHAWTTTFTSSNWFAGAVTYMATAGVVAVAPANATHGHTAEAPVVFLPGVVAPANATHAHTAAQPIVYGDITVDAATHAHTAQQASVTIPAPGFTDNFNVANGPLPAPWVYGSGNFTVVSNRAHCVNADFAVYNSALPGPDHYVEADVTTSWDTTYTIINGRSTSTPGQTFYELFFVPTGGGAATTRDLVMARTVGGGYNEITRTAVPVAVLGGTVVLRLECEGTAQRGYVNGTLYLTTGNTEIATGNYAGFNAQNGGEWDNWAAGGLTVTPVAVSPDNSTHGHTAQQSTLVVQGVVSPDSATHAQTAAQAVVYGDIFPAASTHAQTATQPGVSRFVYPVGVSNRKLIDQIGGVYILNDFSSWAMMSMLTNAEITQALEGVAARHFNCVNVGPFIDNGGAANGWRKFTNAAGQPFFATVAGGSTAGTPFRDPLGAAWSSMDWIVSECTRLGLTLMFSYFGGYTGSNGLTTEMNACTVAEAYTYGQRVWNRYVSNPNIVWHLEWEGMWNPTTSEGLRADAFFHAIQDGHAASGRGGTPLIFAEQISNDTNAGAFVGTGWTYMLVTATSLYMYVENSVEVVDNAYNQTGLTTYPLWDCEPPYVGATQYADDGGYTKQTNPVARQNWRERNYAILIRGGIGINFGDEKWWPFGAGGLFPNATWTWQDVPTNITSYEAQFCWDLLIQTLYCQDPTWVPDNSFLVAGLGTGGTKAAAGRAARSFVVYFPTSRTVTVDTTVIGGTNPIRLRWYDPVLGLFTGIATGETRNATRSVTYPSGSHSDTNTDWVLVVDDQTGGPVSLAGSSAGTATNTSALAVVHTLVATSAGTSTTTSALGVAKPLVGVASAGTSTATATLGALQPLAATAAGVSTTTAALGVAKPLGGSSAGVSTASGTLSSAGVLGGTSAGTSTMTASLGVVQTLVSTAAGVSTTTASLDRTASLITSSAGVSTVTGTTFAVTRGLIASSAGVATTSANLVTSSGGFSGFAIGTSTVTGSLGVAQPLAGSSAGTSTTTGALGRGVPLVSSSAGLSTAIATGLSKDVPFVATAAGVSTTTADLTVDRPLTFVATSAGTSTATGSFSVAWRLAGSSAGLSVPTASLRLNRSLVGVTHGVTTATGTLLTLRITPIYGVWNGAIFEDMYYGDRRVVAWLLIPS